MDGKMVEKLLVLSKLVCSKKLLLHEMQVVFMEKFLQYSPKILKLIIL